MSRVRNYCFTSFDLDIKFDINDVLTFCVYQKELCPSTNKEHLQGYLELGKAMSISALKKHLSAPGLHLEARRGTQLQAIQYCRKKETSIGDQITLGTAKQQGARTELALVYDLLIDGKRPDQILMATEDIGVRNIHLINKSWQTLHGTSHEMKEAFKEEANNLDTIKELNLKDVHPSDFFKSRMKKLAESLCE